MKRSGALLAACALVAACTDIETGPNVVTSLEFEALPFPAVVAGDTLRDINGVAAPLRARVFNSDNDEIPGAPLRYAALEPVVAVDSVTGLMVAGAKADTATRVVAFIGSLQSAPIRLSVVPRPDSAARSGTIDTLKYSLSDTTQNLSGDVAVRVSSRVGAGTVPVRDWIVTFTLQTPGDSTRARIVGENGRNSESDTTSTAGIASRKVRLSPAGLGSIRDSVVVLARARYRGADVSGSPVRLVLQVQPRVP